MRSRHVALVGLAAATLVACGDSSGPDELSCPEFTQQSVAGTVDSSEVTEASGLVASRGQPGILWVHNDSGDTARVFAIRTDGSLVAEYTLDVAALDWEDMAIGRGPERGVDYLYLGDIGDNLSTRDSVTVYRIPEPDVADGSGPIDPADIAALELRYPDGPHDAETLLSDPRTGDILIVTKTLFMPGPTQVFRFPLDAQDSGGGTMEEIAILDLPTSSVATAGDVSADGSLIAVRGYADARIWLRPRGRSIAEALAGEPCPAPVAGPPEEPQGETLAFAPNGRSYFTLSEGVRQPIFAFEP